METALRFPGMLYRLSSVPAERNRLSVAFPTVSGLNHWELAQQQATLPLAFTGTVWLLWPSDPLDLWKVRNARLYMPSFSLFPSFLLSFQIPNPICKQLQDILSLRNIKMSELARRGSSWEKDREGGRKGGEREREGERKSEAARRGCLSTSVRPRSLHHCISVSVGWWGQHSARLQGELGEVFRILCHNGPDPSILFVKVFCAVLLQVVWVLEGASWGQAVVPVVWVVKGFLGFLWQIVLQVLGIFQGVCKSVEVQWLVHVLIFCFGLPVWRVVILWVVHSLEISILSSGNKWVLFHRV